MYSTPLVEAVSLCRKDFKVSWEGGEKGRGERREKAAFQLAHAVWFRGS